MYPPLALDDLNCEDSFRVPVPEQFLDLASPIIHHEVLDHGKPAAKEFQ